MGKARQHNPTAFRALDIPSASEVTAFLAKNDLPQHSQNKSFVKLSPAQSIIRIQKGLSWAMKQP